jgi:hypothetical protein
MIPYSLYAGSQPIELVESVRGFWDGRGWVTDWSVAIQYPPATNRAATACRIVESQTGQRCWVFRLQPEFASN